MTQSNSSKHQRQPNISLHRRSCINTGALTSENVPSNMCARRRFRTTCAFKHADQSSLGALNSQSAQTDLSVPLRKHAYTNILKILQSKKENLKKNLIFHISAQNLDCGYRLEPPRRGGSNEYPQSMFLSKLRKLMYTPVNPSFTV